MDQINIINNYQNKETTMRLESNETNQNKIVRTYTISPKLYEEVKKCADKKGRIISSIINQSLEKFVQASI